MSIDSHRIFVAQARLHSVPMWVCLLLASALVVGGASADAGHDESPDRAGHRRAHLESESARRPAVEQTNFQIGVAYERNFVDETSATDTSSGAISTLEFDSFDTDSGRLELQATVPLTHATGARARLSGSFASESRDESAGSPNSDTGTFGAGLDLFVRDPDLGSFTLGGHYARFEGDDDYEANAYGGSAALQIFFPDFGSGPVDWFVRFEYSRRDDAGTPRVFDPNRDRFSVEGGAGWYFSDNFQWRLGGRWVRVEDDTAEVQDGQGFSAIRWFLPVGKGVSAEFELGGYAGVSEYQEDPFRGDDRFVYGVRGGLTFRFRGGATLLESVRAYD